MNRVLRHGIWLCIAFFLWISPANASEGSQSGIIIVKFAENSALEAQWRDAGRSGEIAEFVSLLGAHESGAYISDALLQAVAWRYNHLQLRKASAPEALRSLSRIAKITFSAPIDPVYAIGKLSMHPEVEYAEVSPQRSLAFIPNDPNLDEQIHLQQIDAFEAWDELPSNAPAVIIAIIDTGIDYDHEDLAPNIFINPGESGAGRETNGIDDDGNGFVDDFRGWDFLAGNGTQDNNPLPGNGHGTHVAGIAGAAIDNAIGIAGVAPNIRLLPVKVGPNNPLSQAVDNGYAGILYAAAMGAQVINCSWGGTTSSEAEQEVINVAANLGALIVAAAGNLGRNVGFYPASYNNVISVGWVNPSDQRAGSSNFHSTIDISAPGSNILSTVPGNSSYDFLEGTSMASPMAAGIAAMIKMQFPNFVNIQIGEQLKRTSEPIDVINPGFSGLIGSGRVDAFRALTSQNEKSVIVENFEIRDADGDEILEPGERVTVSLDLLNVLAPLVDADARVSATSNVKPDFETEVLALGPMQTFQRTTLTDDGIVFTVPADAPNDHRIDIRLDFEDTNDNIGNHTLSVVVNQTYRTFSANNIAVTLNSRGNLGFNDYPENIQGIGFKYKNGRNLMYEGALMIGTSPDQLSSVSRGFPSTSQNRSFQPVDIIDVKNPGEIAALDGLAEFSDAGNEFDVGVSVRQKIFQFNETGSKDFIILSYEVTNISDRFFENLHVGLLCDFDIAPNGANDIVHFDDIGWFGYTYNTRDESLPYVGMQLISSHELNFYAVNNSAQQPGDLSLNDGFTRLEKWLTLTSGLENPTSRINDATMVVSAGPISLAQGASEVVAFSIFAGTEVEGLRTKSSQALTIAKEYKDEIGGGNLILRPPTSRVVSAFPNPAFAGEDVSVIYELSRIQNVRIDLYDALGNRVLTALNDVQRSSDAGFENPVMIPTSGLASGLYYVWLQTNDFSEAIPFVIIQ